MKIWMDPHHEAFKSGGAQRACDRATAHMSVAQSIASKYDVICFELLVYLVMTRPRVVPHGGITS